MCVIMNVTTCMIIWARAHYNEQRLSYRLTLHAGKRNNPETSSTVLTVVPKCHVTLLLSVRSTVCSSRQRAKGPKQCVRCEARQCEWCAPAWGVVLSTLSMTSFPHPPGQDPLHLFTIPSDLKAGGQKNLAISSIFLMNPIFCLRAHTSIAT